MEVIAVVMSGDLFTPNSTLSFWCRRVDTPAAAAAFAICDGILSAIGLRWKKKRKTPRPSD